MFPSRTTVKIAANGRLVIPAEFRKAYGLQPGEEVNLTVDENGIHISSRSAAIKALQQRLRSRLPHPNYSVVDEFLAERRAEAEREGL